MLLSEKYKMGCSKLHQPQTNMPPAIIHFMAERPSLLPQAVTYTAKWDNLAVSSLQRHI